ncbi:MAG: hypothetical protein M3016_09500, partial [Actinomycetota bacterium]|nr:hypothetical protein [Actinomycetota bacterium]
PPPTPLTLVGGAIAGDDLREITEVVADALSRAVAIAIPALGEPIVSPGTSLNPAQVRPLGAYATAVVQGAEPPLPETMADVTRVQLGDQVVGAVLAGAVAESRSRRCWTSSTGCRPLTSPGSWPEPGAWVWI